MRGILTLFGIGAVVSLIFTVLMIENVDEGERGIVLRNGAFSRVANPGMNFVNPIFDSVVGISVRTNSAPFPDEPFYSNDRQAATITLSVNYRIPVDKVEEVYKSYGSEQALVDRLLNRKVKKEVKEVLGQYTAATAIQDREKLGVDINKAMTENIGGPLIIESVQIEDINFSNAYEESIEKIMLADSTVRQLEAEKRQKEVTAQITVVEANAKADAVRATAKAEAEAIRLKGDAEAAAIDARGKALRDNPDVVSLVQAERWNGATPTTMVPGAAIPFLNLKPQ